MTVLDIGSGIRPQTIFDDAMTCVEPHGEYVEWLKTHGFDVVQATWAEVPDLFAPGSFDHITLLDVIEHVEKDTAVGLLERTIPIARMSVTVFTPDGWLEQNPGEDGLDAWGLHGGEWQRHRSAWYPTDFPGWTTRTDHGGHVGLWAVLTKGAE